MPRDDITTFAKETTIAGISLGQHGEHWRIGFSGSQYSADKTIELFSALAELGTIPPASTKNIRDNEYRNELEDRIVQMIGDPEVDVLGSHRIRIPTNSQDPGPEEKTESVRDIVRWVIAPEKIIQALGRREQGEIWPASASVADKVTSSPEVPEFKRGKTPINLSTVALLRTVSSLFDENLTPEERRKHVRTVAALIVNPKTDLSALIFPTSSSPISLPENQKTFLVFLRTVSDMTADATSHIGDSSLREAERAKITSAYLDKFDYVPTHKLLPGRTSADWQAAIHLVAAREASAESGQLYTHQQDMVGRGQAHLNRLFFRGLLVQAK